MSECLTCGDELGRPGRFRYRLCPVDSFDWLGELCVDCGVALFERAAEERCLVCGDRAELAVRRLVSTGAEDQTRTYAPDASRRVLCEAHLDGWSPAPDGSVDDDTHDPDARDGSDSDDARSAHDPDGPGAPSRPPEPAEG